MAKFQDRRGRAWLVELDLGAMTRVLREADVDLLTLHNPDSEALRILRDDPVRLLDVLLALLRPQIKAAGITEEDFAGGLLEEHVWQAVEALLEGVTDYYPPEKRAALKPLMERVIGAARNVRDRAARKVMQVMATENLDELQTKIERQIERSISGSSTGSSPASPASIPVP
jgi:hypothetical protein